MKYNKKQAIQRVFDTCNLKGIDVNVYNEIYKYKVLRKLTDQEIEVIYDMIVKGLKF
jgi:hypothetical protein